MDFYVITPQGVTWFKSFDLHVVIFQLRRLQGEYTITDIGGTHHGFRPAGGAHELA